MSVETIKHRKTQPVIENEEPPIDILIVGGSNELMPEQVIIEAEPSAATPTDIIEGELNGI